ncbi:MAG: hypothetical protein ACP5N7_03980 [Candidatus Pacearchaeota archaeon]
MISKKCIPLVALMSLGACSSNKLNLRPFYIKDELNKGTSVRDKPLAKPSHFQASSQIPPIYSNLYADELEGSSYFSEFESQKPSISEDYSAREALQLPKEFIGRDTYIDTGLVQIAAGDNSIRFRPLYSQVYELSFRHPRRFESVEKNPDYVVGENYFSRNGLFDLAEDDPERVRYERGRVTSALGRYLWSLDIFKPVRDVSDGVRAKANQAVRDVFGSHAQIDYNGERINFGYTGVSTELFDFGVNVWADTDNFKTNGISIEMVFPFGRRNR